MPVSVSYTHLDVYKRQSLIRAIPDPYEWEEKMNALIGRYI